LQAAGIDSATHEPPRPGISLVPSFAEPTETKRSLWWSHEGNRALRDGDSKISFAARAGQWELYDLKGDRAETDDLAKSQPETLKSLERQWQDMNQRHATMANTE
jgi:arylsulfatase A-like enzyme